MAKPPIVRGNLSFREEGRPDQKKKKKTFYKSLFHKKSKYFFAVTVQYQFAAAMQTTASRESSEFEFVSSGSQASPDGAKTNSILSVRIKSCVTLSKK
jgi:hypothetical protein